MRGLTLVIGASENPDRYSNKAINRLIENGFSVIALGLKAGQIGKTEIISTKPKINDVDTVSLYVGPKNQNEWMDYIINLKPKRIIFNPGTENPEFYKLANENKIEYIEACTLVMLSIGNY
jgi:predicted CoA-binding protein